jgi:Domain of unknown function (DUF4342)
LAGGTEAFSIGRKGNEMSERSNVSTEEHKVKGEALLGKVREIVHEGNVRRIIIKDEEGKNLIEIPLTVGVVGVLVAPVAAAIGAIAALAGDYSIEVEREESGSA